MKALDYIPAPIAFVALLIGLGGPFTASGGGKLTGLGWVALGLGAAAMVASLVLVWRSHRESRAAADQRRHVREIAEAEIRLGLQQIVWPFSELFGNPPDRFDLVPEHIGDAHRMSEVVKIDVRSKSHPLMVHNFPDPTWADLLRENARQGTERIDRALQIYSAYVLPGVLQALSELRTSEFLALRLLQIDEYVQMNTDHVKFLPLPFGRHGEEEGFREFWSLVRTLDEQLTKDPARLHRRL